MKKQNIKTSEDRPLTEAVFISTIKELRETFASKKDLKSLPTKEDVRLIVKDELTGYATKEDLKSFATKEDVRLIVKDELTGYATKEDLEAFPTREDLKQEFKKFAETELAAVSEQIISAIEETDKDVKVHEKRITALESAKN